MTPDFKYRLLLLACLGMSCGEPAPSTSTGADDVTRGALLPWSEGNRWTYRVTADGEVTQRVVTVGPKEAVGGTGANSTVLAHRQTTVESSGAKTLNWQGREGGLMVRYREQAFKAGQTSPKSEEIWTPYKIYLDEYFEHLVMNASWVSNYQETKQKTGEAATTETTKDVWKVIARGETVTVPAGTFEAIVLRKTGTSKVKTYWFVRGVGKVKETGEETEELVSYEVTPEEAYQ